MINKFIIYGERHSGTNLLHKFIQRYFGLAHRTDLGNKHFFQLNDIANKDTSDTLVVSICRNPYDWISAMYNLPHHCAFHIKNIDNFLRSEWWSRDEFLGPEILGDRNWTNNQRYKNLFELRYYKLCFFRFLPRLVKNYFSMNYEDFLWKPQVEIADSIAKSNRVTILSSCHEVEMHKIKNRCRLINEHTFNFINESLDWEMETFFGYYPFSNYSEYLAKYSTIDQSQRFLYNTCKEHTNENAIGQIC